MAYDYMIAVDAARLPEAERLAQALLRHSITIASEDMPSFSIDDFGYIPMKWNGTPTGVELLVSAITPERRSAFPELFATLPDCDIQIMLSCRGPAEIAVGRILADVLTDLTDGEFSDPQTGDERRGRRPS